MTIKAAQLTSMITLITIPVTEIVTHPVVHGTDCSFVTGGLSLITATVSETASAGCASMTLNWRFSYPLLICLIGYSY